MKKSDMFLATGASVLAQSVRRWGVADIGDTPVAKKFAKETEKPNELHAALIALMARKDGATIADFQTVEGFNIPSMAALRIAERHGYKATSSKKPGERTVYKAVKRAGG
jgi:hypothetical protein